MRKLAKKRRKKGLIIAKNLRKVQVKDSRYSEAATESYIGVLNFLSKSLKSTCERVNFSNVADYMTRALPKNELYLSNFSKILPRDSLAKL